MNNNYVLGNTSEEIQRLKIQSSLFESIAKNSLSKIGIRNGMKCVDIGCGSGDVTRMIGKMIGKKGQVLGVDINSDYIKYCEEHTKQRNVSFVCTDIIKSNKIPRESFDVVYSRFMFCHVTDKMKALRSMIRIVKKGGTIIIQDLDHAPASWLSYPKRYSVEKLRKTYVKLLKLVGGDPFAGRKLYKMFVDHHIKTTVECYSPCLMMGHKPYNELGWRIAQSLKPQILSLGLMNNKDYKKLFDDLKDMSRDPHSFVLYARLFSVVGKKV